MPGFLGRAHAVMLRTMRLLGAMRLLMRVRCPCLTDKCEEDRRTEETTQQPEVLVHPVLPHRSIGTKHRDPNGQSGRMLSLPRIGPCHVWATGHKNPEARLVPLETAVRPSLGHFRMRRLARCALSRTHVDQIRLDCPVASRLPHCKRIPRFMLPQQAKACVLELRRISVRKFLIISGATLAMVTAGAAADIPHRQPVYQEAQVGKMPAGKNPVGKGPVGKAPVVGRPY